MIIKISYPLEYNLPVYLIMFMEHMYINGLILKKIYLLKMGLLTYGYPKILLIMEMSVILFVKDLKVSICSYGKTAFIIQAKALSIGFLKKS